MKRRVYYLFFFSLLLSIMCSQQAPAYAGLNEWTPLDLLGGKVQASAIDPTTPSRIYVVIKGNSVWRSSDGGETWARSSVIPTSDSTQFFTTELYIDPLVPTRLFSITDGGLLYRSTDSGATWARSSTGLPATGYFGTLAFHPSKSGTIYITSISPNYGTPGVAGVYRSTDGGTTWTNISIRNQIISLVIDPINPQRMYAGIAPISSSAGFYGGDILRSSDGGETWEAISTGLPTNVSFFNLQLEAGTPNTIYALSGSSIYKSINSGTSWTSKVAGLPSYNSSNSLTMLAADPQHPLTFYTSDADGLYKTTDGANQWKKVSSGPPSTITTLMIHPTNDAKIYAGTDTFGLYSSTNGGTTWNHSLSIADISNLRIVPSTPPRFYQIAHNTIAASANQGGSWRYEDLPIYSQQLEVSEAAPSTLYVAGKGLLRIQDDGTTMSTSVLTTTNISTLALHPTVAGSIYFSSHHQLYASANSGATWAELPLGLGFSDGEIQHLAIAPTTPATIYAATEWALYRSADAGATWQSWSNAALGLTDGFSQIVVLADQPQHLYAQSGSQLYTSNDSGATWASRAGFTGIEAFTVAPGSTPTIYAARNSGEILRSTDDGATSTTFSNLPTSSTPYTNIRLISDPTMSNKIYVATSTGSWEYVSTPADIYLPMIANG